MSRSPDTIAFPTDLDRHSSAPWHEAPIFGTAVWPKNRSATHSACSHAERCKAHARRAWAALSAMKLGQAQTAIEALDAERDSASMEPVDLEHVLLRATSAAMSDDMPSALAHVRQALASCEGATSHPATSLLLRLGHWKARRLDEFSDFACSPGRIPARRRDALLSILHLSMESAVEAEQLRLVSAGRLAHEALELSTRFFGPDFSGARLAVTLSARVLYEHNQVDAADHLIRDRLALSGAHGGIEGALLAYTIGARIAAARRQIPFAVLLLREAELLGEERGWPRLVATSLAERARILLDDRRTQEAEECVRRLARISAHSDDAAGDALLARLLAVSRARLELAKGARLQTVTTLRRIASDCLVRRELDLAVELLMLLACATHDLGQDDEAAAHAMRAIELGATAGLYRTFLDGGEGMRALLHWLFERRGVDNSVLGELRPYVRNLLAGFPERTEQAKAARTRHRSGESLSERERGIVTLMSHGLSNKRIARQLGIAPETVKSHAKHILLKLAAQTRVEAVSRALSLGMI